MLYTSNQTHGLKHSLTIICVIRNLGFRVRLPLCPGLHTSLHHIQLFLLILHILGSPAWFRHVKSAGV
jgi:hypothetical protein